MEREEGGGGGAVAVAYMHEGGVGPGGQSCESACGHTQSVARWLGHHHLQQGVPQPCHAIHLLLQGHAHACIAAVVVAAAAPSRLPV